MQAGAVAMAMGRLSNRRGRGGGSSPVAVALVPRHRYDDNCNQVLREAEFDHFVGMLCQPYYAEATSQPSIPLGWYFRMLFVGQYEGLDSEREIGWRCADSLPLLWHLHPW